MPKPQFSKLLGLLGLNGKNKTQEFPKTFFGEYLFLFVELSTASSNLKQKILKIVVQF